MSSRTAGPKLRERRHGRAKTLTKQEAKEREKEILDSAHHLVEVVARVKPEYTQREKGCVVLMRIDKCKWDPIFWGRAGIIEFKEKKGKLLERNREYIMLDIKQCALTISRYCEEQVYKDHNSGVRGSFRRFDK